VLLKDSPASKDDIKRMYCIDELRFDRPFFGQSRLNAMRRFTLNLLQISSYISHPEQTALIKTRLFKQQPHLLAPAIQS
jgi:hypothetical protein